jgi:glycosyltransferase involved in cell wall biosynthesis
MLHGKSRNGKDTFFELLKKVRTFIIRLSFADALKESYSNLFRVKLTDLYNENKEKHRLSLIKFAECCREIEDTVWVQSVFNKLKIYDETNFAVITDFRNKNEYEIIKKFFNNEKRKVITIKINNDRVKGASSDFYLEDFNFDYVIDNNGTLEEYEEKVKELISKLESK